MFNPLVRVPGPCPAGPRRPPRLKVTERAEPRTQDTGKHLFSGSGPRRYPSGGTVALWLLIVVGTGLLACGGSSSDPLEDALVLVVSSDLAVGRERVLVSAIDAENRSLVTDQPIGLAFVAPDGSPSEEVPGRFIWAVPDVRGLWVAEVDLDRAGAWTFRIRTGDDRVIEGAPFSVSPEPRTVGVGERAPPSDSKTLPDTPLESLTTDPAPDLRLYRTTVGEAVRSGRPSVIVFATPAFCTSKTCGPVLDAAKPLIDAYPGVNWIHVEIYENLRASSLDDLELTRAVVEWGLPNEPWVFVVDGAGIVTHRFEGVLDGAELVAALDRVTS